MAKITELINKSKFSFSFEITPDILQSNWENVGVEPMFYSVTWHAKSHENKGLDIPPLKLAKLLRSKNKNVLLHLTCDLLEKEYTQKLLVLLQDIGICNLFVMLGENYDKSKSDFKTTEELIKFIRKETADYFCIGVAGFLDSGEEKFESLKRKIDAGADFVITQAFFESNHYNNFVERCKNANLTTPVIPGVFYFETYHQFNNFVNLCKIHVSQSFNNYVKNESEKISSCPLITEELLRSLNTVSEVNHFHFFTLNKLSIICPLISKLKEDLRN
ncbi:hypothetical protein ACJJTC_006296 [Scirpophaga incertulas]